MKQQEIGYAIRIGLEYSYTRHATFRTIHISVASKSPKPFVARKEGADCNCIIILHETATIAS